MTNEEIIKEFKKGHKGEELMEVAEAEAEIQIALENQKKDILEKIDKLISEKGQSWDSANGLGPDVVSVDDLEDIKEYLT